jgi:hypothetical protein
MKIVRFGDIGINFDNLAYWVSGQGADDSGQEVETLRLSFMGVRSELNLHGDQATTVREWLERNADSSMGPSLSIDAF